MLESQEDNQHHRCEIVRYKDQINNDGVDKEEGSLIHTAGKGFADTYRKGFHASCLIIIVFVNMFANVDAGDTQSIRNTSKNHIPNIANVTTLDERHRQINATDHDRSPDQENCQFAESPIFERICVRKQGYRAECKQSND